jgi:hypothetical protein
VSLNNFADSTVPSTIPTSTTGATPGPPPGTKKSEWLWQAISTVIFVGLFFLFVRYISKPRPVDVASFESHITSLVISWLLGLVVLVWLVYFAFGLFKGAPKVPMALRIWIGLCFVGFSPIRYILLQILILVALPFQSLTALLSIFFLVIPVSLLGLVEGIIVVLPFYCVKPLVVRCTATSNVAVALVAPVLFGVSTILFAVAIAYLGSVAMRWVKLEDLVRATNGPADLYFKTALVSLTTYPDRNLSPSWGGEELTDEEMLRLHVVSVYSDKQFPYYLKAAHPGYVESLLPDSPYRLFTTQTNSSVRQDREVLENRAGHNVLRIPKGSWYPIPLYTVRLGIRFNMRTLQSKYFEYPTN